MRHCAGGWGAGHLGELHNNSLEARPCASEFSSRDVFGQEHTNRVCIFVCGELPGTALARYHKKKAVSKQ